MDIIEELNDLCLSTVLLDIQGVKESEGILLEQVTKILGGLNQEHASLKPLIKELADSLSSKDYAKFLGLLQTNSGHFKQIIEGKTAVYVTQERQVEVSPDADKSLIREFIEKHAGLLEETEALVTEFQFSEDKSRESDIFRTIKGNIHTMKGDAGSVGLLGFERVCHAVEDKLSNLSDSSEMILAFKEWAIQAMNAIMDGVSWPVSSEDFIKSLKNAPSITKEHPNANLELLAELEPTEETSEKSKDTSILSEHPNANLDLLADLMGETPLQTKPYEPQEDHYTLEGDAEIYSEFVAEATDHLSQMESAILDANGSYGSEVIDQIFRAIHSIKGTSAYFKYTEVTEISHITENLLDQCRAGKREFSQELCDLVLEYTDLVKTAIKSGSEAWKNGGKIKKNPNFALFIKKLEDFQAGKVSKAPVAKNVEEPKVEEKKSEKLDVKNFVKIDTERLDRLMDTIGEMGIYSSMLISKARSLLADHPDIINTSLQVEKFSKELQSIGMSMRLIPIRGLFQKMSGLVWDTSKKLGKEVKFIMHGEDTELDRSIIDTLADPLMHMVRNALDHGLKSPEERISAGKSPTGIVELSAYHSGGNIHIKIRDDGRGLDPNKLINKAKEKGILGKDETLSDSEAYQLIFAAGFSTASVVTDLSGRGVGMDVVRRNIESMRGRIMINSSLGKGTTFTIELPLTLAIIDGIQVGVGDQSYLIPTLSVVELLRAKDDQLTRTLDKGETFKFSDRYLPVFRLNELFGITPKYNTVEDSLFVIVETGGEQFVLMCDEILGSLSTVIKSLGDTFGPQRGLSGCCVMPDGSVSLILDMRSILHLAREQYTHRRRHG